MNKIIRLIQSAKYFWQGRDDARARLAMQERVWRDMNQKLHQEIVRLQIENSQLRIELKGNRNG